MTRADHICTPDGAVLLIKWSKTLQNRKDIVTITIPLLSDSPLCPIAAFNRMIRLYPVSDNEPLFVIPRPQGLYPLMDSVAKKHLKDISCHLGLLKTLTFHDFRKDKQALFCTAKSIANMSGAQSLTSEDETETLPARFSNFFMDKIVKMRSAIYSESNPLHLAKDNLFPDLKNDQTLTNIQPATEEEMRKIILASSSASCNLDPIPTPLLKIYVEELLRTITKIVNASLSSCTLLVSMKEALLTPLLEKHHLTLKS